MKEELGATSMEKVLKKICNRCGPFVLISDIERSLSRTINSSTIKGNMFTYSLLSLW
jgi:hypothetical protein